MRSIPKGTFGAKLYLCNEYLTLLLSFTHL